MNVSYINPFLVATADLFAKMIKLPLKLGKPLVRQSEERQYKLYRISAVMDLTGAVTGRIVLSFAQPVAFALAGALMGRKILELDAETVDALGEIANMIVGCARSNIPNAAGVKVTTPTVLDTQDVVFPENLPVMVIPFDTAAGRFIVEVAINTGETAKPAEPPPAPVAVAPPKPPGRPMLSALERSKQTVSKAKAAAAKTKPPAEPAAGGAAIIPGTEAAGEGPSKKAA